MLRGASLWLCGCHHPVCCGSAPRCWSRCPQICFFPVILICGGGRWDWTTTPGEKPLRTAVLGMFPSRCAHALCESHVTLVSTALGPTSTMGISAHGPGVLQMLFSPSHQHRSSEIRAQNCFHELDPLWCYGAPQTVAWPHPLTYIPTKSTKATRPWLGEPWSSIQMLCRDWVDKVRGGCKNMVCAAVRRDFRFSSLTLGLSCAFSSICVCGPFIGVCSRGCPRAQGSTDCGGGASGRPWLGLIKAHPGGGPSQFQERGASTGGERLQWGSSLWTSLNNGALLCGGSGFHKHPIYRAPPSPPPIPSWCLLTVNSSPLPGSALHTPHSSTQPLSAVVDTLSGWVGRARVSALYAGLLCPAATDSCHVLFPQRMRLPFCPNWTLPQGGASPDMETSSLQIPPGLQVLSHFLSSSFFLWSYLAKWESFLSFYVL